MNIEKTSYTCRVHEEFRTIKCSNCGKEFQIKPKSKRTLCNECYNQKRRIDIQRNKKNMILRNQESFDSKIVLNTNDLSKN